jgi:16S rRNA (cytidine1402-2'-O)-methyltransferase
VAWPSGKAEACKASIPQFESGCHLIFIYSGIMLYIIATPIGNLSDITYRAIETLKACDYILCEDTRHSRVLLQHYHIDKPLKSFHKFNESAKEYDVIADLKQGMTLGIISDAGTPGISDPGAKLIQACVENQITVVSIPGPCAAIAAICSSGLDTDRFQFLGFLPRKAGDLQRTLQEILSYPGTTICYESPHRLLDVLKVVHSLAPERQLVITRELTKKFEEIKRGTASELLEHWESAILKGEIVLLISQNKKIDLQDWSLIPPKQHVEYMQMTYELSQKEAIIAVAKERGVSKRDIYNAVHQNIL